MSDGTHLTTWVSQTTKERFAALAHERDVSESALLKHLIELMLQTANIGVHPSRADDRARRESRFSIRLRPEDQLLLRESTCPWAAGGHVRLGAGSCPPPVACTPA